MTGHTARSKRKSKLEPISLAELAETPGMSGFCTFLTRRIEEPVPVLDGPSGPAEESGGDADTPPVLEEPTSEGAPLVDLRGLVFPAPEEAPDLNTGGVSQAGIVHNTAPLSESAPFLDPPTGSKTIYKDAGAAPDRPAQEPQPERPASQAQTSHIASQTSAIIETPILLETPPVSNRIRTRSTQIARRFQPLENARLQRAVLAQDGHTMAEQIIYSALYNAGQGIAPYRDVAVGNRWIMARTGLSERTVQLNLKSLQLKLSIDIVRRHNPDTNEPTVFRVYSFESILERRRVAGLDLVAKKRGGGVRLVSSHTGLVSNTPPILNTPSASPSPPVLKPPSPPASDTAPAPVSETTHLGNPSRNTEEESSSTVHQRVVAAIRPYGPVDDDGVRRLLMRCRGVRPDCTADELLYFIHEKLGTVQLRTGPLAFLAVALPRCLEGESFRQFREQRRLQREADAARDLELARQIVAGPDSGPEELAWAQEILRTAAHDPNRRSKPS